MISHKKAGYLTGFTNYSNFLRCLITAVFGLFLDHAKPDFSVDKILSQFNKWRAHSDDGTNYGASFNYRHLILLLRVIVLGAAGIFSLSRTAYKNVIQKLNVHDVPPGKGVVCGLARCFRRRAGHLFPQYAVSPVMRIAELVSIKSPKYFSKYIGVIYV